jgi:hypothetical protein
MLASPHVKLVGRPFSRVAESSRRLFVVLSLAGILLSQSLHLHHHYSFAKWKTVDVILIPFFFIDDLIILQFIHSSIKGIALNPDSGPRCSWKSKLKLLLNIMANRLATAIGLCLAIVTFLCAGTELYMYWGHGLLTSWTMLFRVFDAPSEFWSLMVAMSKTKASASIIASILGAALLEPTTSSIVVRNFFIQKTGSWYLEVGVLQAIIIASASFGGPVVLKVTALSCLFANAAVVMLTGEHQELSANFHC